MNDIAILEPSSRQATTDAPAAAKPAVTLAGHIVEVISDSGEGAQRCGQSLGAIAARMGNGIWTVEIIPAEIQPPARSVAGASGNRIRMGAKRVTNGGDETDLVVAFNEQVLLGRVRAGELKPGCTILLESMWREHIDADIAASYVKTSTQLVAGGYRVYEVPMERECRMLVSDPRRGKNMFALGMLCSIYSFDVELGREQIALTFGKKDRRVIDSNVRSSKRAANWAEANLDFKYRIPAERSTEPQIVVNGNTALALGVLASGMEICAMYPITPATSASHYLSEAFEKVGGIVHQAEDEIAACAFADRRVLRRQVRGDHHLGTGLFAEAGSDRAGRDGRDPARRRQRAARRPEHRAADEGGARRPPHRHLRQPWRRAEGRDGPEHDRGLLLLGDHRAQDRRDVQHGRRGAVGRKPRHVATAVPASRVRCGMARAAASTRAPFRQGAKAYDWDATTGLFKRFVPGQPNGMHTLTGLAHDRASHVAYDPEINEQGMHMRSLKLAALQKTLKPPPVFGDPEGDLLVVGWGSTTGAIEEAVEHVRGEGQKVSSLHLHVPPADAAGHQGDHAALQAA